MRTRRNRRKTAAKGLERIGIIVVHGIGEQGRFEHLEAIASNLYKALYKDKTRKPHVQLRYGDQAPRHALNVSWREAPALVRWRKPDGNWLEVALREVHWADLDMPMTFSRWAKLVGWSLAVSGVRLYQRGRVGAPDEHGMCPPKGLSGLKRMMVRLALFLVSLFFLLMLVTFDLINWLLNRLSFRVRWLSALRGIIYNYLGDVKLYQDWSSRWDNSIETIGEKSRVAIRRRMVRALAETAKEVEAGWLHGYYIFAHSLGTVVAFNGLMETDLALPNYLTEQEWNELPGVLKAKVGKPLPEQQMPQRAPWLDGPDAAGKHEAINRKRLFRGLRGFLTLGSPLDKFASLWPAIVPVNGEALGREVEWINVADVQDIVGAALDNFPTCKPAPGIGGLRLRNIQWADQWTLATAHTSYWTAGKKERLIDHLASWLEGGKVGTLVNRMPPALARIIFSLTLLVAGAVLLGLVAGALWVLVGYAYPALGDYVSSIWLAMAYVLGAGVLIVLLCGLTRRIWENQKFGR